MIENRWIVYSSRFSGWEMSLLMIMEHILSFQHKTYWKKYDLKNALKKEIFWQKSLTHSINLCTTILMVGHPSAPVSSNARHLWSTKWLSSHLPGRLCAVSNITRAVRLTNCRSSGHATHRFAKFWLSIVLCAPSGMCMCLQFVQEYVLHL